MKKKKKRDQSKPLPAPIPGGHHMTPSPSDLEVMKRYELTERLRFEDIMTYEDDITPFRIWSIMNNEWKIYEDFCDKVRKLNDLDDEIILKKLFESIKKHGWISGHIATVFEDGWHIIDGRHRFACTYAAGVDCFIKPRIFKPEFRHLKEHSIKVFHLLPDNIIECLKLRYAILNQLKLIKNKIGSNYIFSSTYRIPILGLHGWDCSSFMQSHTNSFAGKRVLYMGSNMGFLCNEIGKHAKEVIGVESDINYLSISGMLKNYFKSTNVQFFNKIENEKFDTIISGNPTSEEIKTLLNNEGIVIKCPLQRKT